MGCLGTADAEHHAHRRHHGHERRHLPRRRCSVHRRRQFIPRTRRGQSEHIFPYHISVYMR